MRKFLKWYPKQTSFALFFRLSVFTLFTTDLSKKRLFLRDFFYVKGLFYDLKRIKKNQKRENENIALRFVFDLI